MKSLKICLSICEIALIKIIIICTLSLENVSSVSIVHWK